MINIEEVKSAFTPKEKLSQIQLSRIMKIQKSFYDLATELMDLLPENADRTACMRLLLESKMTATQSVTHAKEYAGEFKVENDQKNKQKFEQAEQYRIQNEKKQKAREESAKITV